MCHSNRGAFRDQLNFLRRQFLQDGDLPFTNVLTEEVIAKALAAVTGWLDRIFSPLVTLWVFLGQVLSVMGRAGKAITNVVDAAVVKPDQVTPGSSVALDAAANERCLLLFF